MKKFYMSLFICFVFSSINAQKAIVTSGGNTSNGNYSASYSIGETTQHSSINAEGILVQGVQQPYEIFDVSTLNVETAVVNNNDASIKIYPNPSKDYVNLSISNFKEMNASYQLYDLFGKLIKHSQIQSLKTQIEMNSYAAGTYFLKIQNPNGNFIKTFKIIKH